MIERFTCAIFTYLWSILGAGGIEGRIYVHNGDSLVFLAQYFNLECRVRRDLILRALPQRPFRTRVERTDDHSNQVRSTVSSGRKSAVSLPKVYPSRADVDRVLILNFQHFVHNRSFSTANNSILLCPAKRTPLQRPTKNC